VFIYLLRLLHNCFLFCILQNKKPHTPFPCGKGALFRYRGEAPISKQNLFLRDFLVNSMGRANRRWRFARPKTIFSPLSQWKRGLGERGFWTDTKLQSKEYYFLIRVLPATPAKPLSTLLPLPWGGGRGREI